MGPRIEAGTGNAPAYNNNILYLGLNKGASSEVAALRAGGANVREIKDGPSTISVDTPDGKKSFNLENDAEVRAFTKTLGLSPAKSEQVAKAILSSKIDSTKTGARHVSARDELAQLALTFSKIEKGEIPPPTRLVVSGHMYSDRVFGDDNGGFDFSALKEIAGAFPEASKKIEDVHLAGCNAGRRDNVERFKEMYPNLQTLWAYKGTSPEAGNGSELDLKRWESSTRGANNQLGADTKRSENVVFWNQKGGYADATRPLPELERQVKDLKVAYSTAFTGIDEPKDGGKLREYYQAMQNLKDHPSLPAPQKAALAREMEKTIRLIKYSDVAKGFASAYKPELTRAYGEGNVPDFRFMSRKEALKAIDDYDQRLAGKANPSADELAVQTKLHGLRDLDSSDIIHDAWL